jgi:hypothetical protein
MVEEILDKEIEDVVDEGDEVMDMEIYLNSMSFTSLKRELLQTILYADYLQLISFSPYPSGVRNVILEQSHNCKTPEHDFLNQIYDKLIPRLYEFNLRSDNKIVIEFKPLKKQNGRFYDRHTSLFYSFKDNINRIGLECFHYDGVKPKLITDNGFSETI